MARVIIKELLEYQPLSIQLSVSFAVNWVWDAWAGEHGCHSLEIARAYVHADVDFGGPDTDIFLALCDGSVDEPHHMAYVDLHANGDAWHVILDAGLKILGGSSKGALLVPGKKHPGFFTFLSCLCS